MKEEQNKTIQEPLDRKSVERIQRLTCQEIQELKPEHLMKLTHDFDERYSRLVVVKGCSIAEQKALLEVLWRDFENRHISDYWNNEPQYDRECPVFFGDWDFALAVGEMISVTDSDDAKPLPTDFKTAPTLSEMLEEEGLLKNWIESNTRSLVASLNQAQKGAGDMLEQIKVMRDGSLSRMQKELEKQVKENGELKDELENLREFKVALESWQVKVVPHFCMPGKKAVTPSELLMKAHQLLMQNLENEKKLKEENERLRTNQEKWRESDEYLEEKRKWNNNKQQSIDISAIRQGVLDYVESYRGNFDNLENILFRFNEILSGTVWRMEGYEVKKQAMSIFTQNKATPLNVKGDYVMNKSVVNEVSNVESGGTGINLNK